MTKKRHSAIGGSGAHRWINCPGSVRLCKDLPKEENEAAKKGTAVHFLAEWVLKKELPAATAQLVGDFDTTRPYLGVADEIVKCAQIYVDFVRRENSNHPNSAFVIEREIHLDWLHKDLFGTVDAVIRKPSIILGDSLVVADYKNGFVIVEPENNEQLMYYALGCLGENNSSEIMDIRLAIIQPNAPHPKGPIRQWMIGAQELIQWGYDVLKPAAYATEDPKAPLKCGDWCKYCRALKKCDAIRDEAFGLVEQKEDKILLPAPHTLSPEKIARILQFAEIFPGWAGQVKASATQRAQNGEKIPNHKLVRKNTGRRWKNEEAVIGELSLIYDEDTYLKPVKRPLKTISEMEKVIGKESVRRMVEKPEGDLILVSDKDPRKEITFNPDEVFGKSKNRFFTWCGKREQRVGNEICVKCSNQCTEYLSHD